ncbi:MAG: hypothetical protein ACT4OX_09965 [Actinomycetota bacterium]
MSRRARAGIILAFGIVAAVLAHLIDANSTSDDLALLAAGIVMGELLVLRLEDASAVPLSYAVMLVLASSFGGDEFIFAVLAAELVSMFVRPTQHGGLWRVEILLTRVVVAGVTLGAYHAVRELVDHEETVVAVLGALGAAAFAQVLADVTMRTALRLGRSFSTRGRLAWLAVASSGMLMAIGYRGVDGEGDVGIWGPLLFATPLLAAWYAFERLDSATLAYRQTIESLAMAPEMGGIVPAGHAQRVARLVVSMGGHLGFAPADLNDLEMAALLHHLGQVTLDDPEVAGVPAPGEVAAVTGGMLREIRPLAAAGEIVAGDSDDPRRRLEVQVLRLASEYDDLTVIDGTPADVAIETLRSAPGYVYEDRVLNALERTVRGHGAAAR